MGFLPFNDFNSSPPVKHIHSRLSVTGTNHSSRSLRNPIKDIPSQHDHTSDGCSDSDEEEESVPLGHSFLDEEHHEQVTPIDIVATGFTGADAPKQPVIIPRPPGDERLMSDKLRSL
ncbi:hypothetical protein WJX77_000180 [Trebouxia sp. C0004]